MNWRRAVPLCLILLACVAPAWSQGLPPQILNDSPLPDATVGRDYSVTFSANGPATLWYLEEFPPPPGLSFSTSGVLSGRPTQAGAFTVFVFADLGNQGTAYKAFTLTVLDAPPLILSSSPLPNATLGRPYSFTFTSSYAGALWFFDDLTLPPGLSLSPSGVLSGTPTHAGIYTFMIYAEGPDTPPGGGTGGPLYAQRPRTSRLSTGSASFRLTVETPPLSITTTALPPGTAGVPYSAILAATGGTPPYAWGILFGAGPLPDGLRLGSDGAITGTPAAAGAASFTVYVADHTGQTVKSPFTLPINPAALSIGTPSLAAGVAGQPYTGVLAATGGAPPYTWSVTGLPAGLSADAQGAISGTPQTPGAYTVSVVVTDSRQNTASGRLSMIVTAPPVSITTGSPLPDGSVGQSYQTTFAATGGVPPYTWSGVSAAGLTLSSDGVLSGTPATAGQFSLTVQVKDSQGGSDSKSFGLTIKVPPLAITTSSLPNGTLGAPYSATLAASGASGSLQWSASGLPQGLNLGTDGTISGTPAQAGTFSAAVTVSGGGATASRTLALVIGVPPLPAITFSGLGDTAGPATQPGVVLGLAGSSPAALSGAVALTFAAADGGDDPTVQFSNGSRTAAFNIPAGANLATFTVPNLALQTGTTAGTITLTASLRAGGADAGTPSPAPTKTIRIMAAAPVIARVSAARTSSGVEVTITGYSTTRELTQASFLFTAKAGSALQNGSVPVPITSLSAPWYQSAASRAYGSQFTYTQAFTLQGDPAAVTGVLATLANSAGISNAVSAPIQ